MIVLNILWNRKTIIFYEVQKAIAFQRHLTSRNVATLLSHAHYHCDMVLAFELSRALQIFREVYWIQAPTTLSQLSSFSKSARQHSKDYHVKFLSHVYVFLFVFYIIKFFSRFFCIRLDKKKSHTAVLIENCTALDLWFPSIAWNGVATSELDLDLYCAFHKKTRFLFIFWAKWGHFKMKFSTLIPLDLSKEVLHILSA